MRILRTTPVVICIAMLCIGCGRATRTTPTSTIVERTDEPAIIYLDDTDPRMVEAIKKARSTVRDFTDTLQKPSPTQKSHALKMLFKDGEQGEHMWLTEVKFDGAQFTGMVSNDPDKVKTVRYGQRVSVAPDQISDWKFVDSGVLRGGYTLRAMRDALPAAEREKLDKSVDFKFE